MKEKHLNERTAMTAKGIFQVRSVAFNLVWTWGTIVATHRVTFDTVITPAAARREKKKKNNK